MKTIEEKAFRDKIDRVELEELMYDEFYELIEEAIKIGKANGHEEAMRWRDPKQELPEEGVVVFVKILSSCGAGDEILYTSSAVRNDFYHSADADPFGCEGYYSAGNGGRVRATVIGWRPIG